MSIRPGYTSARGIQPKLQVILYQSLQIYSLLTAVLQLFCLYRLNLILQVSWFKYTAGISVLVCSIDPTCLTLCKYCIPNHNQTGVCEPNCLVATIYFRRITLEKNCSCTGLLKNTSLVTSVSKVQVRFWCDIQLKFT